MSRQPERDQAQARVCSGGIFTPLHFMDKTKSRLAAFFDNDEDDSSFPVRRIELLFSFISRSPSLSCDSKRPWTTRSSLSMLRAP